MGRNKAEEELNRGKRLVEAGVFLLILNVLVAAHLWVALSHHWQITGPGLLLNRAWIRQNQELLFTTPVWESSYVFFLHFLFRFLGNHHSVAIIANLGLQLLGLFLFYRTGRRLTTDVISLLIAGVLALVSVLEFSVVQDSAEHFLWFASSAALWLLSWIKPICLYGVKRAAEKKTVQVTESPKRKKEGMRKEKNIEGETKNLKLIPNPLPLPKKHIKKVMGYAFEPSKELMHYDLNNYNVNDDYDLRDV